MIRTRCTNISDTLLLGCIPLLVEGPSDQIYLQSIKNYLIGTSKYKIGKELVFIPTGVVKGMSPVIKILLGRDNELSPFIIDSYRAGRDKIEQLRIFDKISSKVSEDLINKWTTLFERVS